MSLQPGGLITKDPSSTRNGQFNWTAWFEDAGAAIATPTVTVAGPDASLVVSGVAVSNSQKVIYQVTGGTVGVRYTVTCRIVTNESPAQTDERSFTVLMENE